MKQLRSILAVWCALALGVGMACAQEEPASPAAGTTEQRTLQQQIDELRAKLEELEAKLQQQQTQAENQQYASESAMGKLVTGEKVKLSGYIQSQFASDRVASPRSDFKVRRARLKLEAPVTDMAGLTLQVDAGGSSVTLKDAYLDLGRTTDGWRMRAGQAKVPFLYEVLESSSNRLEAERTLLSTTLWPSERDIGAWLQFSNILGDRIPGTTLDLGAMNGQGPSASDLNNNKDVVARLRFVLGREKPNKDTEANTFYLAYQDGKFTKGTTTTDKQIAGAGISYATGPWWIRGEFVTGEHLGHDIQGWYGHLAYAFPRTLDTIFARYELYDENRDQSNADYKNLTLGWEHKFDAKTRLVLAHDFRNPDLGFSKYSSTNGGLTTLRLQVKY